MSKNKSLMDFSPEEILESRNQLWRMGNLQWKLSLTQRNMLESWQQANSKIFVINAGRRVGKCIPYDLEIMTPTGPVPMGQLKVGDTVYGFDSDGEVRPTKIVAHQFQGNKEVIEIKNNGRLIAESTLDHVWGCLDERTPHIIKNRKLKDFKKGKKIPRRFVEKEHGNVSVPNAYSLGAFLGDGYCNGKGHRLFISSQDESVVKAVAGELNLYYKKEHPANYNWSLNTTNVKHEHGSTIFMHYYNEWCKGKLAHQKIADIEQIKLWDKQSKLKFLAGLIDTDGSVSKISDILTIQFGCQAFSVVQAVQYLLLDLFQYKPKITVDNRTKYKNGPLYKVVVRNNYFSKKIVKELDHYLHCSRKKWNQEYEKLKENNVNPDYVGIKLGNVSIKPTYDIQIANDTNLYLTAEGLVTHNSYILSILALEQCLQKPGSIVKFLQPEKAQVQRNIVPIMEQICVDCPADIRPTYKTQKSAYVFPNGSEIQFAGTDGNNYENLRGSDAHLCLIDEAGFLNAPLGYIIRSIFIQSTLRTKGKIILSSSTPTDPNHEFMKYVQQAILGDRFIAVTTPQCLLDHEADGDKNFTRDMYDEMVAEYPGGENDPEFRRECMNELVTDGSNSVVPEFSGQTRDQLVRDWKLPVFCDKYVAMDIGFKDLTVVLFAFYDYDAGIVVVQDEIVMNGPKMTTEKLAQAIRKKEAELWTDPMTGEQLDPYMRVSDNNLILLNDLSRMHGLHFMPTAKDNKEAQINNLRLEISGLRLAIQPRCKTLITHLTFATWDKQRKDFTRTQDGAHADALDALIYLIRNIQRGRNPYPPGYSRTLLGSRENVFFKDSKKFSDNEDKWAPVFRPVTRKFGPKRSKND